MGIAVEVALGLAVEIAVGIAVRLAVGIDVGLAMDIAVNTDVLVAGILPWGLLWMIVSYRACRRLP